MIFKKKQWKYLKALGADNYLGKFINGFQITASGLLAAAHLKGAGAVSTYLHSSGTVNSKDAFGTSVEAYLKQFSNYDVTEIIN